MDSLLHRFIIPTLLYVWHALTTTIAQFVTVGLTLAIIALVLFLVTQRIRRRLGYKADTYITGWIGAPVHELSHAAACILFRHRITECKLYQPDVASGSLGYVRHSYDPRSAWAVIGNFFIGLAPFVGGSLVLYLLARLLLHVDLLARPHSPYVAAADFVSLEAVWALLSETFTALFSLLVALLDPDRLLHWRFWLFAYLAFAVGSHMAPSPADLAGARQGLALLFAAVFLLNLIVGAFGGVPHRWIVWTADNVSGLSLLLLIALTLNLLWLAVLELTTAIRKAV